MDVNDSTLNIYETLVNVNGYGCVSASKTSRVDINTSEQTYTFEAGSKVLSNLNKSLLSYDQLSNISSNTNLSNITGRYQWVSDIIYTDSVKRLAFGKESSSDISIDDSGTLLCYIRGCSETKVDGGRN